MACWSFPGHLEVGLKGWERGEEGCDCRVGQGRVVQHWLDEGCKNHISLKLFHFLLNISMSGAGMNFMTVSTMLSSSSSSPQPVGTAFFGRVRLPSEACSIAAAASASFSSFFLMPYYRAQTNEKQAILLFSCYRKGIIWKDCLSFKL